MIDREKEHKQRCMSKAGRAVGGAVERGDLPKLDGTVACVDCGGAAKEYDHRDYGKPLEVEPTCRGCNQKRGPAKIPPLEPFWPPRISVEKILKLFYMDRIDIKYWLPVNGTIEGNKYFDEQDAARLLRKNPTVALYVENWSKGEREDAEQLLKLLERRPELRSLVQDDAA